MKLTTDKSEVELLCLLSFCNGICRLKTYLTAIFNLFIIIEKYSRWMQLTQQKDIKEGEISRAVDGNFTLPALYSSNLSDILMQMQTDV